MTKKLLVAALLMLSLDAVATGYGTLVAGHEAQVSCAHDHGTVQSHECIRNGHVLFGVPL